MYIKEVNIDGFKSYAQRVCLTNLDPGFNAITGLNGSGKSNILDSLCFVMGIKKLEAVSACSLPVMKLNTATAMCLQPLGQHSGKDTTASLGAMVVLLLPPAHQLQGRGHSRTVTPQHPQGCWFSTSHIICSSQLSRHACRCVR